MQQTAVRPTQIKRIERHAVEIVWSDGHRSLYPNHYLRNQCPCAECRERPPHVLPVIGKAGEELHPVQIGVVGRYAISIQWSDGHDTGIYSYQTLRSACPCTTCRPEAQVDGAPQA